jgi:predicted nucleotidyltransferase
MTHGGITFTHIHGAGEDAGFSEAGIMARHGLTMRQLGVIADTLRPYLDKISSVGLFGSRAVGSYRDNSDIDMVLFGTLEAKDVDRLHSLFEDSSLPMSVDVTAYHLIDYPPLKAHIDAVMLPLFADAQSLRDVSAGEPAL